MVEITSEEKTKLFEKLPKELRDFMESENTGAFLLYLGGKYKLNDDKISLLSKLVGDVILGITPITSLAQEINLKITTDSQTAMNLSQELYTDLLSPVMSAAKPLPTTTPTPMSVPTAPLPLTTDRYREPTNGAPGIVDLRKIPPIIKVEPPPPPPPPRPLTFTKPIEPIKPKPLTPLIESEPHRQQPVAPQVEKPITNLSRPHVIERVEPPVVSPSTPLRADGIEPQYIIRPPGLSPIPTPRVGTPIPVERGVGADLPRNILDLKKDKGEF